MQLFNRSCDAPYTSSYTSPPTAPTLLAQRVHLCITVAAVCTLAGCATPAATPSVTAPRQPASHTQVAVAAALPVFTASPAPNSTPGVPRDTKQETLASPPALRSGSSATDLPGATATAKGFTAWRSEFMAQAAQAGISAATVRNVLGTAQWVPRVVELDGSQAEFTRTPWAYLDSAASPLRIRQGRGKLTEHAAELERAAERYGVPATVITAIWGMESNYGSNFGSFRTVDALATLAYEGRRRTWAQKELLAALKIIDAGDIAPERMIGSWAGAMGHTQFLPSVFLAHAVDADGDGHRDIWGSVADVTASTAAFLQSEGWRRGEIWGAEVRLPTTFDYRQSELSVRKSAAQWAAEGVEMAAPGASRLPPLDSASVITPAGALGPAFLVGHNFRTLLRYNNAITYALGVSQLSQQLDGGPGVLSPWPRHLPPMSREQLKTLQVALSERGFDAGEPDGVQGPATRAGVRAFQQSRGLVPDGYATVELLDLLHPDRAPQGK